MFEKSQPVSPGFAESVLKLSRPLFTIVAVCRFVLVSMKIPAFSVWAGNTLAILSVMFWVGFSLSYGMPLMKIVGGFGTSFPKLMLGMRLASLSAFGKSRGSVTFALARRYPLLGSGSLGSQLRVLP